MFLEKIQNMRIECRRIFQTTCMSGTLDGPMLGAGDTRAHFFAALERIIELAVHDQHRHFQFRQARRQVAVLQGIENLGDGVALRRESISVCMLNKYFPNLVWGKSLLTRSVKC